MATSQARYTAVAILLHWGIAAAIIANLIMGWWMNSAIDESQTQARAVAAFQIHKSLGLTILALSLLRLLWRLFNPPPPFASHMPAWERMAARVTHWLFYLFMLAVPLSGWLYVSTQWRNEAALNVPTLWFGMFEIPHLFGLNQASLALREQLAGYAGEIHELLAYSMACLLVLHVLAALKHHLINRDQTLANMLPLLSAKNRDTRDHGQTLRKLSLGVGSAGILLAISVLVWALFTSSYNAETKHANTDKTAITWPAGSWAVVTHESRIGFSGVHAGAAFQGRFDQWQADVRLDESDLTQSQISARVETASAQDGVPLHDNTLPQAEWFNSSEYPIARYQATTITPSGANRYQVQGMLTIKNRNIPVDDLFLVEHGDKVRLTGTFVIDRKAADLGMASDPNGQWVSREITVDIQAVFQPPE